MIEQKRRWDLQLFAEGAAGDGGAAGAEGTPTAAGAEESEDPAVAGREWLKSNGATDAQITDGRAKAVGKQLQRERKSAAKANGNAGAQVAAAAEHENGGKQTWALPEGTTWEQIMSVPEMNARMQETVQKAKRDTKNATATMEALTPALEMLAKHHGLDISNGLDHKALAEKILNDDSLYEAKALQMGVDVATARKLVQQEQKAEAENRQKSQTFREEQMQKHFLGMVEQSRSLAQEYPGFDLNAELKNPAFARLTQPAVMQALGGLKGVYEAVHREELAQARARAVAEQTRQQTAKAVQSGSYRPTEMGGGVPASPAVKTSWSREEMDDIAARVRRGEKIAL